MKTFLTILSVGFVLTLAAAPAAPAPKAAAYVGSAKSTVYHLPSCASAKKINAENLIKFATKDEAAKRGYRACKVCKP